jgi:hypothetical protein
MARTLGVTHPLEVLLRPDFVQTYVCTAASSSLAFDVPAGMHYVVFGAQVAVDFGVAWGATVATVPATATTAGTSSPEWNPTARNITSTAATTGFAIVALTTGIISMSWYV